MLQVVGFNVGEIATYDEMAIVFNNEDVDIFTGFNLGLGAGVYPVDGMVGVGHLVDLEGNIVKNPDIINAEMPGVSMGGSVAVMGGVAVAWNPHGYKFVIKFMETNASISGSGGITKAIKRDEL